MWTNNRVRRTLILFLPPFLFSISFSCLSLLHILLLLLLFFLFSPPLSLSSLYTFLQLCPRIHIMMKLSLCWHLELLSDIATEEQRTNLWSMWITVCSHPGRGGRGFHVVFFEFSRLLMRCFVILYNWPPGTLLCYHCDFISDHHFHSSMYLWTFWLGHSHMVLQWMPTSLEAQNQLRRLCYTNIPPCYLSCH